MSSIGPYHQKTNMLHMFDFRDLRGPLPQEIDYENSLSYIISNHPNLKKFRYILRKSGLNGKYNDAKANLTLFVPEDAAFGDLNDSFLVNLDLLTCRNIVKTLTLNNKLTSDILSDNPCSYFITQNSPNKLFISNVNGETYLNRDIRIIEKDIMARNGIIHIIDGLLIPDIIN